MKITTWNVNGVRTVRHYHPWSSTTKHFGAVVEALGADILCLQETKITRRDITAEYGMVPGYHAFYAPCRDGRPAYAGVATFVRQTLAPIEAEEGFSGLLGGPSLGCYGALLDRFETAELLALDREGRVLITDHQLFVLFNVYFPNDASPERGLYKQRFNVALATRVAAFRAAGREVVVVGDVNVAHRAIDHCDPVQSCRDRGIADYDALPARQWLTQWLDGTDGDAEAEADAGDADAAPKPGGHGGLVDVFRHFHPTTRGAYTCWNTLKNARPSNYGTRIDYVLATPGLLGAFADCSVDADVMGSDHCPVSAVMGTRDPATGVVHDTPILAAMTEQTVPGSVPLLCTKFWDVFSGRQQTIGQYFGAGAAAAAPLRRASATSPSRGAAPSDGGSGGSRGASAGHPAHPLMRPPSQLPTLRPATLGTAGAAKRSTAAGSAARQAARGKAKLPRGQQQLGAFLQPAARATPSPSMPPSPSPSLAPSLAPSTPSVSAAAGDNGNNAAPPTGKPSPPAGPVAAAAAAAAPTLEAESIDIDALMAAAQANEAKQQRTRAAWRSVFTPAPAPRCWHGEPAKAYVVNKRGPNQGAGFFLCARPIGPTGGLDAARDGSGHGDADAAAEAHANEVAAAPSPPAKRRRVVNAHRCDFFAWKNRRPGGTGPPGRVPERSNRP